jgi:hypothetical protein
MNVDKLLRNYVDFLNGSIENVLTLTLTSSFDEDVAEEVLYDWLQASWEMLVESVLFYGSKRYLPVYGIGADLGLDGSSRVTNRERLATDKIVCISNELILDHLSNSKIDVSKLDFEEFVNWDGRWYSNESELNSVRLSDGDDEYVVSLDYISFELKPAT